MTKAKILGKLEGIIASAKEDSRNGRKYTEGFWDAKFDSPLFKEGLENKVFFGQCFHPDNEEEYNQIHLDDRSAVVLTDVKKRGLDYYGTFEILPTKAGQCVRNLLDIGVKFGISSRGLADYDTDVFDESVAPSYDLITWDLVAFPGVKSCRLHEIGAVAESYQFKKSKERIMETLNQISKDDKDLRKYIDETLKMKEDFDDSLQAEDVITMLGLPEDYLETMESNLVVIGDDGVPYFKGEEVHVPNDKRLTVESALPGDAFFVDNIYYKNGGLISVGDWTFLTNLKRGDGAR